MAFTYTPANNITINNYGMLTNGTAFDTSPSQFTDILQSAIGNLTGLLSILFGTDNVPLQLQETITTLEALRDHLDNHYDNIITNMSLVVSGIGDAIGFGIIGQPGAPTGSLTNPSAAIPAFFGSIMGDSNAHVANIANVILALSSLASTLLAGAIISELSVTTNPDLLTALGTLKDPDVLTDCLTNQTPANLTLIGATMVAVGALFMNATEGSALASLPEVAHVISALNIGAIAPTTGSTTTNDPSSGGS